MHQFSETQDALRGFSRFYHDEVRPGLLARDAERIAALRRGRRHAAVALAVAGPLAALGWLVTRTIDLPLFLSGVGVLSALGLWLTATARVRKQTKTTLVGAVAGYVGWDFTEHVGSFDYVPWQQTFLLPSRVDRANFEDALSGDVRGARFTSVEAHLERMRRDSDGKRSYSTAFRGQLMRLDFPTRTFGRTVVLRDGGWFNAKRRGDMKRVGIASPRFEKIFEAYGTDQVEARVVLDPAFLQRIIDLESSVSGKNIRFAFADNQLLIAVDTPDQFEAGSMRRSLDNPPAVQKLLDEIGTLLAITDGLLA